MARKITIIDDVELMADRKCWFKDNESGAKISTSIKDVCDLYHFLLVHGGVTDMTGATGTFGFITIRYTFNSMSGGKFQLEHENLSTYVRPHAIHIDLPEKDALLRTMKTECLGIRMFLHGLRFGAPKLPPVPAPIAGGSDAAPVITYEHVCTASFTAIQDRTHIPYLHVFSSVNAKRFVDLLYRVWKDNNKSGYLIGSDPIIPYNMFRFENLGVVVMRNSDRDDRDYCPMLIPFSDDMPEIVDKDNVLKLPNPPKTFADWKIEADTEAGMYLAKWDKSGVYKMPRYSLVKLVIDVLLVRANKTDHICRRHRWIRGIAMIDVDVQYSIAEHCIRLVPVAPSQFPALHIAEDKVEEWLYSIDQLDDDEMQQIISAWVDRSHAEKPTVVMDNEACKITQEQTRDGAKRTVSSTSVSVPVMRSLLETIKEQLNTTTGRFCIARDPEGDLKQAFRMFVTMFDPNHKENPGGIVVMNPIDGGSSVGVIIVRLKKSDQHKRKTVWELDIDASVLGDALPTGKAAAMVKARPGKKPAAAPEEKPAASPEEKHAASPGKKPAASPGKKPAAALGHAGQREAQTIDDLLDDASIDLDYESSSGSEEEEEGDDEDADAEEEGVGRPSLEQLLQQHGGGKKEEQKTDEDNEEGDISEESGSGSDDGGGKPERAAVSKREPRDEKNDDTASGSSSEEGSEEDEDFAAQYTGVFHDAKIGGNWSKEFGFRIKLSSGDGKSKLGSFVVCSPSNIEDARALVDKMNFFVDSKEECAKTGIDVKDNYVMNFQWQSWPSGMFSFKVTMRDKQAFFFNVSNDTMKTFLSSVSFPDKAVSGDGASSESGSEDGSGTGADSGLEDGSGSGSGSGSESGSAVDRKVAAPVPASVPSAAIEALFEESVPVVVPQVESEEDRRKVINHICRDATTLKQISERAHTVLTGRAQTNSAIASALRDRDYKISHYLVKIHRRLTSPHVPRETARSLTNADKSEYDLALRTNSDNLNSIEVVAGEGNKKYPARYFMHILYVASGVVDYVNEDVYGERVLIFRLSRPTDETTETICILAVDFCDVRTETYAFIRQLELRMVHMLRQQKELLSTALSVSKRKLFEDPVPETSITLASPVAVVKASPDPSVDRLTKLTQQLNTHIMSKRPSKNKDGTVTIDARSVAELHECLGVNTPDAFNEWVLLANPYYLVFRLAKHLSVRIKPNLTRPASDGDATDITLTANARDGDAVDLKWSCNCSTRNATLPTNALEKLLVVLNTGSPYLVEKENILAFMWHWEGHGRHSRMITVVWKMGLAVVPADARFVPFIEEHLKVATKKSTPQSILFDAFQSKKHSTTYKELKRYVDSLTGKNAESAVVVAWKAELATEVLPTFEKVTLFLLHDVIKWGDRDESNIRAFGASTAESVELRVRSAMRHSVYIRVDKGDTWTPYRFPRKCIDSAIRVLIGPDHWFVGTSDDAKKEFFVTWISSEFALCCLTKDGVVKIPCEGNTRQLLVAVLGEHRLNPANPVALNSSIEQIMGYLQNTLSDTGAGVLARMDSEVEGSHIIKDLDILLMKWSNFVRGYCIDGEKSLAGDIFEYMQSKVETDTGLLPVVLQPAVYALASALKYTRVAGAVTCPVDEKLVLEVEAGSLSYSAGNVSITRKRKDRKSKNEWDVVIDDVRFDVMKLDQLDALSAILSSDASFLYGQKSSVFMRFKGPGGDEGKLWIFYINLKAKKKDKDSKDSETKKEKDKAPKPARNVVIDIATGSRIVTIIRRLNRDKDLERLQAERKQKIRELAGTILKSLGDVENGVLQNALCWIMNEGKKTSPVATLLRLVEADTVADIKRDRLLMWRKVHFYDRVRAENEREVMFDKGGEEDTDDIVVGSVESADKSYPAITLTSNGTPLRLCVDTWVKFVKGYNKTGGFANCADSASHHDVCEIASWFVARDNEKQKFLYLFVDNAASEFNSVLKTYKTAKDGTPTETTLVVPGIFIKIPVKNVVWVVGKIRFALRKAGLTGEDDEEAQREALKRERASLIARLIARRTAKPWME